MNKYQDYLIEKVANRKLLVFGMGSFGMATVDELIRYGFQVKYFVDNNPDLWGREYKGINCVAPDEVMGLSQFYFLIAVGNPEKICLQLGKEADYSVIPTPYMFHFADELEENRGLLDYKLERLKRILSDHESVRVLEVLSKNWFDYKLDTVSSICTDSQYFHQDIVPFEEKTVYVDCGAYNGDTLSAFISHIGIDYLKKYYAFELSKRNCEDMYKYVKTLSKSIQDKVCIINKGVSDVEQYIYYNDSLGSTSYSNHIDSTHKGELVRIDKELKGKSITHIKMDIEGAERAALWGARDTIRVCLPILQICVYHKLSDIWEIPFLIDSICPNKYDFFLRHHTSTLTETVLYAVPKQ